ncbi:class I lanthipeptide [Chitinophaga solisilvae]|uniref:class I lanthipeptide n=1 Tax=Chitinophaga solisilvae TaxID=1233460 RepID=UPI001369EAA9|nr:class I lanthipeptide [Chitinophaga solisilvae]
MKKKQIALHKKLLLQKNTIAGLTIPDQLQIAGGATFAGVSCSAGCQPTFAGVTCSLGCQPTFAGTSCSLSC